MKNQCTGSDKLTHTSDYNVMIKKTPCPVCGKLVKTSGAKAGKVKISKHSVVAQGRS